VRCHGSGAGCRPRAGRPGMCDEVMHAGHRAEGGRGNQRPEPRKVTVEHLQTGSGCADQRGRRVDGMSRRRSAPQLQPPSPYGSITSRSRRGSSASTRRALIRASGSRTKTTNAGGDVPNSRTAVPLGRGDPSAFDALQAADRDVPEEVQHRPWAQQLTRDLLSSSASHSMPPARLRSAHRRSLRAKPRCGGDRVRPGSSPGSWDVGPSTSHRNTWHSARRLR
jgi:hypothetical protein